MSLLDRLARLERLSGIQERREQLEQERRHATKVRKLLDRFSAILDAAWPHLAEEDQSTLEAAMQAVADDPKALDHWPLLTWMDSVRSGTSRLPELSAEVSAALIRAWLSSELDERQWTCKQCGLLRPCRKQPPMNTWKLLPGRYPLKGPPPWYDLPPDFFAVCPACGAEDADWSHLVANEHLSWKSLPPFRSLAVLSCRI
jgi:hypothetical protein